MKPNLASLWQKIGSVPEVSACADSRNRLPLRRDANIIGPRNDATRRALIVQR